MENTHQSKGDAVSAVEKAIEQVYQYPTRECIADLIAAVRAEAIAETIASDKLEWRGKHDIMVHRKNEAERMLQEQTAKLRELADGWKSGIEHGQNVNDCIEELHQFISNKER